MNALTKKSVAAAAVALSLIPFVATQCHAAVLVADYQFNNTFDSSVGAANPLTPISQSMMTGSFSTETVNGVPNVPVFVFSNNRGLIASTSGVVPSNSYSAVFLARLSITPPMGGPPIIKILDFKNRTTDAGQYVVGGQPTFYDGLLPVVPGAGLYTSDVYAHFALTRDSADDKVSVYLNGSLLYSFVDTTGLTTLSSNVLTLFADDPNTLGAPSGLQIEAADGAIARLQLYDGALTAGEVAGLNPVVVPESAMCGLVASIGGALVAGVRQYYRRN